MTNVKVVDSPGVQVAVGTGGLNQLTLSGQGINSNSLLGQIEGEQGFSGKLQLL
jgi:hypothetical protein